MNVFSTFTTPGIVFVLTLASGFWLSNTGKPLNTALFTVHKLIALGAVVATGVQLFGALRGAQLQALVVALLVVAGLSVVVLFATGALMSLNNANYSLLHTVHRVAPVLFVIALVLAVYLTIGRPL